MNIFNRIFGHPKTTVAGMILGGLTILFTTGKIDAHMLETLIAAFSSVGLIISKDKPE